LKYGTKLADQGRALNELDCRGASSKEVAGAAAARLGEKPYANISASTGCWSHRAIWSRRVRGIRNKLIHVAIEFLHKRDKLHLDGFLIILMYRDARRVVAASSNPSIAQYEFLGQGSLLPTAALSNFFMVAPGDRIADS